LGELNSSDESMRDESETREVRLDDHGDAD
jgi:hypothetical protein